MQKTPLIVANWKMNGSRIKVLEDLNYYASQAQVNSENIIFALPYVYLSIAQTISTSSQGLMDIKYKLASQDVSQFSDYGAYTGEVSATMLHDLGVKYALVGHSERRVLLGDTKQIILRKLCNLVKYNITPIYCVGEGLKLRETGQYKEFLLEQLDVLASACQDVESVVIAYEPIWSIGTGVIPQLGQIEEVIDLISAFVQKKLSHVKISAVYGGSVNSKNITEILQASFVEGVLVGGASLDVKEFAQICYKAKLLNN